jgi:hypothetical protein
MSALPSESSVLHVGKKTARADAPQGPRFVQTPARREVSTAQAAQGLVLVLLVLWGIGVMAMQWGS